ncbi:MAG: hypothetical protein PHS41_13500, partial [Victivallaceae bacterium]|nr:hypothetical protein [Victivallaceae bacterium]
MHNGSHNPEYFGVRYGDRTHPDLNASGDTVPGYRADPNLTGMRIARQKRLEKINALYRQFFPDKMAITGGSGEVGSVYSTHLYHTWGAPVHELRAFCQRYSLKPSIPLFIGEMCVPYPLSLYYPILNPNQRRPMYYENAVRFLGNEAYRYTPVLGNQHQMQFEQRESGDRRSYSFVAGLYTRMLSEIMRYTMTAWRYHGLNGLGSFGYANGATYLYAGVNRGDRLAEVPDKYTLPWAVPEVLTRGASELPFSHTGDADLRPSPAGAEFLRAWDALAVDFFGAGKDVMETDHAYFSAESFQKQLVLMNDLHRACEFELTLYLTDAGRNQIELGKQQVKVEGFSKTSVPVRVKLPEVNVRTAMKLVAKLRSTDDNGKDLMRSIDLEVFPVAKAPKLTRKFCVFDPEGRAVKALKKYGIPFQELKSLKDEIASGSLLLIGRRAFSLSENVPDLNMLVERNVNVLVLEQEQLSSPELMNARERYAFINDAGHPILQGFEDRDFSLWRGNFSLAENYQVNTMNRNWQPWGNRNMLAGYVFRRPSHGNYRALLVSGFDLYQTALFEYSGDKAAWIACQLDVTERIGMDPVATHLFFRMLSYLNWRGARQSDSVAFFGGERGKALLDKMQVLYRPLGDLSGQTLAGVSVLLISDPDFAELEKYRFELNRFVYDGNRVIYLQNNDQFSASWLPFTLNLKKASFRNAVAKNRKADGFWLAGYSDTDFAYEREYQLPVFTDYPKHWDAFDPGVLLRGPHGDGEFVFFSLTPELFGRDYAAQKTGRLLSSLLTSAGVKINANAR